MTQREALLLSEPKLLFGFDQSSPDPKEGLFLFGPVRDLLNPRRVRVGVVGTPRGIGLYTSWVRRAARPILAPEASTTSVFFPGFRELFACEWPEVPDVAYHLPADQIAAALRQGDRHLAVFDTVSMFTRSIQTDLREEENRPDVWFVIVPDEVYKFARPLSYVPTHERTKSATLMNARLARKLISEPSLFEDDMAATEPYLFDLDFRNQLKARLIETGAVTQIVRESTLMEGESTSTRRLQDAATVAWNLSLSTFYKAGGKPWRLAQVRDGVCYVGLVFKRDATGAAEENACCGAQMFLNSGDGLVFKGRLGPWYAAGTKEYHLTRESAADIARGVVDAYRRIVGSEPKEVFIHGKTRFNRDEWLGFTDAMPSGTKVVAVRITRSDEFKLYRPGRMPVVRGTLAIEGERLAYLWTSGFVPDLGTYPGWETPNPLRVEVCMGECPITDVASDVFMLTKLNFNACIYGDGLPVTLRFADAVGEILTAAPRVPEAPLPFKHYI